MIRPDDNGDGGSTGRLATVLGYDHDVGDGAVEVAEIGKVETLSKLQKHNRVRTHGLETTIAT